MYCRYNALVVYEFMKPTIDKYTAYNTLLRSVGKHADPQTAGTMINEEFLGILESNM